MNATRSTALSCFVVLAAPAAAQVSPGPQISAVAPGFEADSWSPRITLRTDTGEFAAPVHVTQLPDGRLVFMGYSRPTDGPMEDEEQTPLVFDLVPDPLGAPFPKAVVVPEIPVPLDFQPGIFFPLVLSDDLFCSGHTLTSDGALFTAGGTRGYIDLFSLDVSSTGLPYATHYDGTTWTRLPAEMLVIATMDTPARWYPAVTRLPDERLLVTGGYDFVYPLPAPKPSTEIYDPATGGWQILSDFGQTPFEIWNSDYTHPFVLPAQVGGSDLLVFGEAGLPLLLSLQLSLIHI